MNKADLVEQVLYHTELTKKTSREAVDAVTSVISYALARGEKVTLVELGTFRVTERKARRGRIKLTDTQDLVASLVDGEKPDLRVFVKTDS